MNPILLFKQNNFSKTIWWKLKISIPCYLNEFGNELVTEASINRLFRLVESDLIRKDLKVKSRLLVQFFEDGYICWIDINNLKIEKYSETNKKENKVESALVKNQMSNIVHWIVRQSHKTNRYKWGGTLGPNFDCSGLIQTAFFQHNIFIPRDSYQIQNFCTHLFNFPGDIKLLEMGDILFFGKKNICNHVAIYFEKGCYYHSSGKEFGRDGIGIDKLYDTEDDISKYYNSILISAGRVTRNYRWDKAIR